MAPLICILSALSRPPYWAHYIHTTEYVEEVSTIFSDILGVFSLPFFNFCDHILRSLTFTIILLYSHFYFYYHHFSLSSFSSSSSSSSSFFLLLLLFFVLLFFCNVTSSPPTISWPPFVLFLSPFPFQEELSHS